MIAVVLNVSGLETVMMGAGAGAGDGAGAGGGAAGLTLTVTSLVLDSDPSNAVSLSVYVPLVEKLAVVLNELALPKLTVPAPSTLDHVVFNELVTGNPSSPAVPLRLAVEGNVIVCAAPALTVGAWFAGKLPEASNNLPMLESPPPGAGVDT